MKTRIVKRKWKNGDISYVLQRKILWFWCDIGDGGYYGFMESYPTLEEAQKNLCYYDGTKNIDTPVESPNLPHNIPLSK